MSATVKIADIKRAVARHFEMADGTMESPERSWPIARPRQVAMCLARRLTTRSLPYIGRKFGGRDHTTVLHACRAVNRREATDPDFALVVASLQRGLIERAETPRVVAKLTAADLVWRVA
jgi:chromosomal replication initiator protein